MKFYGKEVRKMPKITLEAARRNAGLTQQQLAEKLDVSRELVNAWEAGRAEVKAFYLYAICHVTGFNADDIILPKKST
jgi:transcriptional regulator with XRE-family HTH domain